MLVKGDSVGICMSTKISNALEKYGQVSVLRANLINPIVDQNYVKSASYVQHALF